jgi:hypothetical protein
MAEELIKFTVRVEDFDRPPRELRKRAVKAINAAAMLTVRRMNKRAQSGIFKHPTGRYADSIKAFFSGDRMTARITPMVVYKWWIEEGALASKGVPRTHRKSAFRGYHIVRDTAREVKSVIDNIVYFVFRGTL